MTYQLRPPLRVPILSEICIDSIKTLAPLTADIKYKTQYWAGMTAREIAVFFADICALKERGEDFIAERLDIYCAAGIWQEFAKVKIREEQPLDYNFSQYCYRLKPREKWIIEIKETFSSRKAATNRAASMIVPGNYMPIAITRID